MMMLKLNQHFKENAKCIWESKSTCLIPVSNLKENFSLVYYGLKWNKILLEENYNQNRIL